MCHLKARFAHDLNAHVRVPGFDMTCAAASDREPSFSATER
jgi:hypothetical protein